MKEIVEEALNNARDNQGDVFMAQAPEYTASEILDEFPELSGHTHAEITAVVKAWYAAQT